MGHRPLLGTALLAGKELVAQFVNDGLVTVDDVQAGVAADGEEAPHTRRR
jgi:hypothetical protein